MKIYSSTILMITICTLTFLSCSKKKDDTPPPINYGTVVFWTKNAAKLAACSNNISIRVTGNSGGPYGAYYQGTASITFLSPFEPSDCRGNQSVPNLKPGVSLFSGYDYSVNACGAGGTASPWVHFTVSEGECLKIEIL